MKKYLHLLTLLFILTVVHNSAKGQYTKLLDFVAPYGQNPYGSLYSDGNFLYGTTMYGGTFDGGNLFRSKLDGTAYTNLFNIQSYQYGDQPKGSLISDGPFLYGMTSHGNNIDDIAGSIFKIKPDGSSITLLHIFSGYSHTGFPNGGYPYGSLISDGTYLYGMTSVGGTSSGYNIPGYGTIFRIKTDGSGYTVMFNFNNTNGARPFGTLISDGTFMYGMTSGGGVNNIANGGDGTIFKINPDGTGFAKLLDFAGDTVHGTFPDGSLVFDGTYLYGMTSAGGLNNKGTIFKIKTDGSGYEKLLDFTGINGNTPKGSLILDNNYLYGMTYSGGTSSMGVVFRINTEGCWYSKLLDFTGFANGSNPSGDLLSDGTFLYGMTTNGGANNVGTLFKIKIPDIIITQSITLCQGQSITVGSHTYNTTGSYMDTLASAKGCGDSLVATHLTVLSSSSDSSTQTLAICSGQSVSVGTDVYTTSGTYTYTFQGNGCDSTVTTYLTVNPSPNQSISGATAICFDNSTTLTASGGVNYLWSTGSTSNSITVSPSTEETYWVIATIGSCSDTSTVLVTVDHPPVAAFNSDYSTCCESDWFFADSSYCASSDTIVSWNWSMPGATPSQSTLQNPSTQYSLIGHYTVCLTITTAHGCTDSICHTIYNIADNINELTGGSSISISPNPFNSQTVLRSGNAFNNTTLMVDNIFGQTVKHINNISGQSFTLQRENLPFGLYILRLMQDNKTFATAKLVIVDN